MDINRLDINKNYFINEVDENYNSISYYGKVHIRTNHHFIMKVDETVSTALKTITWACSITGVFETNWINRATLSYFSPSVAWESDNLIENI